jgi:hypothetical protein
MAIAKEINAKKKQVIQLAKLKDSHSVPSSVQIVDSVSG